MKQPHHTTLTAMETTFAEVWGWAQELDRLHGRIAPRFARPEPRHRALAYLRGVISSVERKNGWQLAEHAGEARPDGMQRLLSSAIWDADLVRDDVRSYILEQLGDPRAVLVIDETSFPKRGDKSAGVGQQYCGTTGQVENCQVGVFLAYASAKGHTLLDRELSLPKRWVDDRERCREAGIPETIDFQTKPELARRMIERIFQAQIPVAWVVADTVYGSNLDLRTWLEAQQYPYVLAVACTEPAGIQTSGGRQRVEVAEVEHLLVHAQDWQRLSMSEGSKGPRWFDWACVPMLYQWEDDGHHWLLIRRSPTDPTQKTSYLVFAPQGTTLLEMVEAIGARWHIEEDARERQRSGLGPLRSAQLDRVVSPYHPRHAGSCVPCGNLCSGPDPHAPQAVRRCFPASQTTAGPHHSGSSSPARPPHLACPLPGEAEALLVVVATMPPELRQLFPHETSSPDRLIPSCHDNVVVVLDS